jgi:hypothetical protein
LFVYRFFIQTMKGVYVMKYKNGVTRLINLRNVYSVFHKNKIIRFNYTAIDGNFILGSGDVTPAYDEIVWDTEKEATDELEKITKAMELQ